MTESKDVAKLDNFKQHFQRLASFLIKVQLPYPFEIQQYEKVHTYV